VPRRPDLEAVLATLGRDGEAVVRSWLATLDVALEDCPPLALVASLVAVKRLAHDIRQASPQVSQSDAIRRAAEALGLEDDSDLATHPADAMLRTLRRWRASGQNDRAPADRAA
jgi:hypothetical protein